MMKALRNAFCEVYTIQNSMSLHLENNKLYMFCLWQVDLWRLYSVLV